MTDFDFLRRGNWIIFLTVLGLLFELSAFTWIITGSNVYSLDNEMSETMRYYSGPRQIFLLGLIFLYFSSPGFLDILKRDSVSFLFCFFWVISIFWSEYPDDTRRALIVFVMQLFVGVVLVANCDTKEFFVRLYKISIAYFGVCFCFIVLFPDLAIEEVGYVGALRGILAGKNPFGHSLVFFMVFLVSSLIAIPEFRKKTISWIVLSSYFVMLVLTQSATSLAAFVTSVASYFFIKSLLVVSKKIGDRVLIVFLFLASSIISVLFFQVIVGFVSDLLGRDTSLTGRDQIWDFASYFIGDEYWFGYGFGGFWPRLSLVPNALSEYGLWEIGQMHNGFIEALIMGGVIGLALTVLYFVYVAFWVFYGFVKYPKSGAGGFGVMILIASLILNITESDFPNVPHMTFTALVLCVAISKMSFSDSCRCSK